MSEIGITSIAAYLPKLRLARKAIADANKWAKPAIVSQAKGCRTSCAPDEDSLTMAIEASRTCLAGAKDFAPTVIHFASTTAPFKDRANSVLLSEALAMPSNIRCGDSSGFLGAGVTALINALCTDHPTLIAAADKRAAKPGSPLEMTLGHGAAAVTIGSDKIIARLIEEHTTAEDFVDHYRSSESDYDYIQEERWVRDEGQMKIVLPAIKALLAKANLDGCDVQHFTIAGVKPAIARQLAKSCGIPEDRLTDSLDFECGNTGTAHALLMLCHAIEHAGPNERILLVNVAQGAQCILFETTEEIEKWTPPKSIKSQVESGLVDHNYNRFLSFNDQLDMDWGVRAERDNRTSLPAFNRHRKTVTSFIGGECIKCGTKQFPKGQACVNPACRCFDTLIDHPFQNKIGKVKSFTEDWLAISTNPPLMYGNVAFEGGGVIMMEFADFEPSELKVGQPVRFVFRIKDKDSKRNFCRYFWKAVPANIVKAK